ncbi:flagellar hook-basal body complex protein [Chelativorans sp. ZYF759]|uniref:flagellar hook protein FlgE n=1 Tax=Chelativorans sp. ZYF759 TaxID=2692213 RepID=UPI00145DEA8D|nr:flagellar hook protein FlgE [Chelativorans sp. ZYF759]NMG40324.1 flagellar hook-basal body complex protein [Chelativorans sp. ZYF759]
MGLYGMMRTGVSGMAAQANRLATVADNIANSNTTGYKRAYTEFSSLIIPGTQGNYNSGGVKTSVRYAISQQGPLQFTASSNDLAINGDGFFVVKDSSGSPFLARAGTFVPDGQGRLVNAAGFYLTGYSYENGNPAVVANGFDGLEIISIADSELSAEVSETGVFAANLPADAVNGDTEKSSLVVYDHMGRKQIVDLIFTKTAAANEWTLEIFDEAGNSLQSENLLFDPTTGRLDAASSDAIVFDIPGTAIPGPAAQVTLDLSSMTQFATGYNVATSFVSGSAPSQIQEVKISSNGVVSALYKNGAEKPLFRIPLASVQSPDQLAVLPGNVYTQSPDSGDIKIGFPESGQFGSVVSGALEGSNVDIAEELTNMIESQRNYTANSKIFQTGSDLLDVLVNLKR